MRSQPALAYYRSDGDGRPYLLRAIQGHPTL
jgi:hypothetical protein